MALRLVLVGLVGTLGFQPPNAEDLSRWADMGREFCLVRLLGEDEATQRVAVAEVAKDTTELVDLVGHDGPTDRIPDEIEAEFAARIERELAEELFAEASRATVERFLADRDATEVLADAKEVVVEKTEVVAEATEIAAIDDVTESTVMPAEAVLVVATPSHDEPESPAGLESLPDEIADADTEAAKHDTRTDRVATALRLTGDALYAWANLIQSSDESTRR